MKASANTTLQAQVQAAAQTPAATPAAAAQTPAVAAQPAVQTQAAAPVATVLVQLIVHLHHLIQLVNVHGVRRHWLHGLAITGATAVNGLQVQRLLDSVQDLNHKLVLLHVGMMVDMDT